MIPHPFKQAKIRDRTIYSGQNMPIEFLAIRSCKFQVIFKVVMMHFLKISTPKREADNTFLLRHKTDLLPLRGQSTYLQFCVAQIFYGFLQECKFWGRLPLRFSQILDLMLTPIVLYLLKWNFH